MFADLLLEQAPLVQFKWGRALYRGKPDQLLDFTTMEDTASFTARAAMEEETPRFLRIAGDAISSRNLQAAASSALGKPFS
jgi:hypothetical protein